MDVSTQRLHRVASTLQELAAELRSALAGDRTGPADPAWATDTALVTLSKQWDGYLSGLASRLDSVGAGLVTAAAGYGDADERATVRYGRRLC
jgi:hypothetical protein